MLPARSAWMMAGTCGCDSVGGRRVEHLDRAGLWRFLLVLSIVLPSRQACLPAGAATLPG